MIAVMDTNASFISYSALPFALSRNCDHPFKVMKTHSKKTNKIAEYIIFAKEYQRETSFEKGR